jgi:ABC-2 type transport system permease protein
MNGFVATLRLDLKRFWCDRTRVIFGAVQPLLYLFVLGSGLGASVSLGNRAYMPFIFPGVVSLALLVTASFAAINIVFDRQVGFLRAILVAPVPRLAIAFGKIAAGALQALVQGAFLLAVSPFAQVHFSVMTFVEFVGSMMLSAWTFSALGIAIAVRFRSVRVFPIISNGVLLPLFFLSGGLYSLESAPHWLRVAAYLDPVAYAVDLMRGALLQTFRFPVELSLSVLATVNMLASTFAVREFVRGDEENGL